MTDIDDVGEFYDDEGDLDELICEYTEDDELLHDTYSRTHVSTRGVIDEEIIDQTEQFRATPFLELMKDVHILRTLFGPSNPTINDLTEEIESEMRMILHRLETDCLGLMLEVSSKDPNQLQKLKEVADQLLQGSKGGE